MQMPNAQGLAGLMSQGRAPQQPQQPQQPMPSPNKASPMAGLGSVEDRVAAYRGNPAPLQQRYQMSQDLLDLLALQKIKSEKEAAARQMQLAMGQQQAAQGMEPQTIAQQREKEVHDLTKAELAQQRGETAQHQAEQQQQNLQQAMAGGIARAPGAAMAAQPKAMASGGIVAFDEGGSTDKEVQRILAKDPHDRTPDENAMLQRAGVALQRRTIPQGSIIDRMNIALGGSDRSAALNQERDRNMQAVRAEGANLRPTMANDPRMLGQTPPAETVAAPAAAAPGMSPAAAAPGMSPAASAAPATPALGIAGLPAAAKPAGLEASLQADYNRDSEVERKRIQDEIRQAYALTPEQRAVFDQGIAQRQKMFDETYDPERQRREGLKQYLLGAGGRRYGEFAGGAKSAMGYDEEQRQAKLKDFESMQKSREGLVGLEREGIKPSIEGGLKALEQTRMGRSDAQRSAQALYGTDVQARDHELNRRVEMMKAQISAETNRIQREGLDLSRASAALTNAERLVATQIREIDEALQKDPRIGMLMMKGADKLSPAEKTELETAQLRAEQAKRAIQKSMEPVIASNRSKLGVTSATVSKEEQALIDQYTKGK